jgi:gliding motility-associated-like protein
MKQKTNKILLFLSGIRYYRIPVLLVIFLHTSFLSEIRASHIVGGEIYYECLGNNNYKITLKLYRDCYLGQAPYDNPAYLAVYSSGSLMKQVNLYAPKITKIPVVVTNPCLVAPPNVCVQEGIYTTTINLPPNVGGYDLVYQRCCRNQTIVNLITPDDQGATYFTHIPGTNVVCNSEPYFKNFPPVAICANDPLLFDHSATDPDGDSLVYSLCAPFKGASPNNPQPSPPAPPPYSIVNYIIGFNGAKPLNANPPLTIDPNTGMLYGTPKTTGQYVVGVCVDEYRNGVLIGRHFRDFQFNIVNCDRVVKAIIPIPPGDTSINNCKGFDFTFDNNSIGGQTYFWDFGIPGVSNDTSTLKYPSIVFPDTGVYRVMLIVNPGTKCTDTDYVSIKVYPYLDVNFGLDNACPGDSIFFSDSSSIKFGVITDYQWNFGNGDVSNLQNPVYAYPSGGNYNVALTIKNNYDCRATIIKPIEIYPKPQLDFSIQGNCIGQPVIINNLSTISGGVIKYWKWDFGDFSGIDTLKSATHVYKDDGNFQIKLIAISDKGCMDSIIKDLNIVPKLRINAWGDTTVCAFEPVQLFADGGTSYTWGPLQSVPNFYEQNPVVKPARTTVYTVTVANSCNFDTATVKVKVNPLPDLWVRTDTSLFFGDSVLLKSISRQGVVFRWEPAESLSNPNSPRTFASPLEHTVYTITTTDSLGCVQTAFLKIYVREICDKFYIPNAFTPNGDGINDLFSPIDYGQNQLISIQIFNRWGKLLFESEDAEAGWDGTYNNKPQPLATYVYQIFVECNDQIIPYRGNFTLLR